MNHWLVAPVLLPLTAGALLLVIRRRYIKRRLSLAATLVLLLVSIGLVMHTMTVPIEIYRLGNWPLPFGIALALDRLSATMLLLTNGLALAVQLYAWRDADRPGKHFQALIQFQLVGLNATFLASDLFNLFVCFEILLIASYGLLFYGAGAVRTRATLAYVVLNLIGSALFLIAIGVIFGVTGTLNLAHLAERTASIAPDDLGLLAAGARLLLVVFALKAALAPLGFWLPLAYTAAMAPVVALFCIMTKVGAYAVMRIYPLVFSIDPIADWTRLILLSAAFLTLALGVIGMLASTRLREVIVHLVTISVGTLFCAVAIAKPAAISAAAYYMVHSTVATAGLFLLADLIAKQRAEAGDLLRPARRIDRPWMLGTLFILSSMAVAGLPPFSGFIGKLLILQSVANDPAWYGIWFAVLGASLMVILTLSRAGSLLFWRSETTSAAPKTGPARQLFVVVFLIVFSPLFSLAGGPVIAYMTAIPWTLEPSVYIEAGSPEAGFPPEATP